MPKTESTNIDADISGLTFAEIEAKYGEEAAINAGIAADPDTFEADAEWFARARPAIEVDPELVKAHLAARARGEKMRARVFVTVEMDLDIAQRLGYNGERADYDDWQKRVNDALRKMVFGEGAGAAGKSEKAESGV